ncbi:toxin-antitoxin system HicB family antitoxin [Dokdonella sp.]|uniref:type II toxin-antitoxin system HicB family antitoxin n=1 Tax=Dokdonella sp. TaxID=2291710 RepID=UPI0025BC4392|nr:toxin-antitoxin system HicB family antitoxin [Dokdonella sp.]MBX3688566.1 toxin-antitoxin system HicB family antitoxin [Dokdonella sp.]
MNAQHYTYRVIWSEEDGEFVGLCAEFPGLSWLAPKMEDALGGIARIVGRVVRDLRKQGETVPEPISARRYSGRFQVRIPPQRHRLLAVQAAEQGISLNRLVSDRLA